MARSADREQGQYMVEFGVLFVVFVIFILGCFSVIVWAFNANVLQQITNDAARKFAIGGQISDASDPNSDRTLTREIDNVSHWEGGEFRVGYTEEMVRIFMGQQLQARLIPVALMHYNVDAINFRLLRLRNMVPDEAHWAQYTDGNIAQLTIDYHFGIGLGMLGDYYMRAPISSELVMYKGNDGDWDGRDDNYEGGFAADHDNDGDSDSTDGDDDGDGVWDTSDTGTIVRDGATGVCQLWTYSWAGAKHGSDTTWAVSVTLSDEIYHVSEWYAGTEFPHQLFYRRVPTNADGSSAVLYVSLRMDKDNDGWDDCFDYSPNDPNVH